MNRSFPKRVLMTADTVGGVWTYALELSRALAEYDLEIGLATMGAPLSSAQRDEVGLLPHVNVFESSYKLEWMNEPWSDLTHAGDWLLNLEDEFQPDLIHLNQFSHGALPWRAPKIVVGHSCVLSWWRAVKGSDAPSEWDTYREKVTDGLQLADLVVAPSQAMLAALQNLYGPLNACAVISNGRRFDTHATSKRKFVFAAGRLWDDAKNISTLAKIAPQLSWPVYVAGETNHPDGRSQRCDHVHHLGKLSNDEMLHWLERASIYALPARYEPFGLSILEAALCGCALVLGDIPSLRENWNGAALFVPPDDPAALKSAVEQLISEPAERAELAANARRVASQLTPEKMAQRYLALYTAVLPKREPEKISNLSQKGAAECAS